MNTDWVLARWQEPVWIGNVRVPWIVVSLQGYLELPARVVLGSVAHPITIATAEKITGKKLAR